MSTSHTSMHQRVFRTRPFESNGFHQSAAIRDAVSRIHIYMLTPQTFRTMVCVTIPLTRAPQFPQSKSSMRRWNFFVILSIVREPTLFSLSNDRLYTPYTAV